MIYEILRKEQLDNDGNPVIDLRRDKPRNIKITISASEEERDPETGKQTKLDNHSFDITLHDVPDMIGDTYGKGVINWGGGDRFEIEMPPDQIADDGAKESKYRFVAANVEGKQWGGQRLHTDTTFEVRTSPKEGESEEDHLFVKITLHNVPPEDIGHFNGNLLTYTRSDRRYGLRFLFSGPIVTAD